MIKLKGELATITFKAGDFAVLKVLNERGQRITVLGDFPDIEKSAKFIGLEYEFHGEWEHRRNYGRSFRCYHYRLLTDKIYFFLCQFTRGIGKKTAKKILNAFKPDELEEVLKTEPRRLLEINGIGRKTLEKLEESWKKFSAFRKLSDFFSEKGANVTQSLLVKTYRTFGDSAVEILKEDPYQLTKIRGIGFKTADPIAVSLGVDFDSFRRISAACAYAMKNEAYEKGNTLVDIETLEQKLEDLLTSPARFRVRAEESEKAQKTLEEQEFSIVKKEENAYTNENGQAYTDFYVVKKVPIELIRSAILELVNARELLWFEDLDYFGLNQVVKTEQEILQKIKRSRQDERKKVPRTLVKEAIEESEALEGYTLSPEQKQFIYRAASGSDRIIALAGYAGTGKTTVCKTALKVLERHFCHQKEIVCCAFTGMAASRIQKVTGYKGQTIHSLLKFSGDGVQYNETNPLPYRVVVLDEASMVDVGLFACLLRAIGKDTLFIMVGDPAQLPPMGPGFVFGDLVEGQVVPATELKKIYRQSEDSVLVAFASEIRQGEVPLGAYKKIWKDFEFQEVQPVSQGELYALKARVEAKKASQKELVAAREKNNRAILLAIMNKTAEAKKALKNPIWEFQVLSPMRGGILGTKALNKEIQGILNPYSTKKPELNKGETSIRLGDKVVHLINFDMKVMDAEDFAKAKKFSPSPFVPSRVYNGSLGIVVQVLPDEDLFYVEHADGRVVEYSIDDFGSFVDHAFALTVHKSQGSQYKEVVIPMTTSHWQMLNNQWLYTAITRATDKVTLIGQKYAFERACKNTADVKRKTYISVKTQKDSKKKCKGPKK